jgi:DNA-binding protein H-NS
VRAVLLLASERAEFNENLERRKRQRTTMKTYANIKSEIARLEKEAEALRKSEVAEVIGKIRDAINVYDLTAGDLGLGRTAVRSARATPAKSVTKASTTKGIPKYRDPKSGKMWTGRGKPPAWIAGVKNRDPFLIEAPGFEAASQTLPKLAPKTQRKTPRAGAAKTKLKMSGAKGRSVRRTTPEVQLNTAAASE